MLVLILPAHAQNKNLRNEFHNSIIEIIDASYEYGVFASEDCSKDNKVGSVKYNNCIKECLSILKSNVNRIKTNDCERNNCTDSNK
jgi:hypothetical protein